MSAMLKVSPMVVKVPLQTPPSIRLEEISVLVEGPQSVSSSVTLTPGVPHPTLSFVTDTIGTYKVNVRHNGIHIPLSPIMVAVNKGNSGPLVPPLPETYVSDGRLKPATIQIDARKADGSPLDENEPINIKITGPEAVRASAERNGTKIRISFETMVKEGVFYVNVSCKGQPILNSPFELVLHHGD